MPASRVLKLLESFFSRSEPHVKGIFGLRSCACGSHMCSEKVPSREMPAILFCEMNFVFTTALFVMRDLRLPVFLLEL